MEIKRSKKFGEKAQILSDFIIKLSLTTVDNDKLIALLIQQIQEAEANAYYQGFEFALFLLKADADEATPIIEQ